MIATCPDVAGFRAEAGTIKPAQSDSDMHMITVGIRMTRRDPRRAQGRQAHQIELRHGDRVPCVATGPQLLRQRQRHVQNTRAIRQAVQPVAEDHGIRTQDCATDELCTRAKVVVGQDARRLVEGVVRAHRSSSLRTTEVSQALAWTGVSFPSVIASSIRSHS